MTGKFEIGKVETRVTNAIAIRFITSKKVIDTFVNDMIKKYPEADVYAIQITIDEVTKSYSLQDFMTRLRFD